MGCYAAVPGAGRGRRLRREPRPAGRAAVPGADVAARAAADRRPRARSSRTRCSATPPRPWSCSPTRRPAGGAGDGRRRRRHRRRHRRPHDVGRHRPRLPDGAVRRRCPPCWPGTWRPRSRGCSPATASDADVGRVGRAPRRPAHPRHGRRAPRPARRRAGRLAPGARRAGQLLVGRRCCSCSTRCARPVGRGAGAWPSCWRSGPASRCTRRCSAHAEPRLGSSGGDHLRLRSARAHRAATVGSPGPAVRGRGEPGVRAGARAGAAVHAASGGGAPVRMLADLWNAPDPATAVGCSTTGSSEACMLAGLALKRRWQHARRAVGRSTDRPNLVMGVNVQICWDNDLRRQLRTRGRDLRRARRPGGTHRGRRARARRRGVRRDDRAVLRPGSDLGLPSAAGGVDQHLRAQVRAGLAGDDGRRPT